MKKGIVIFVFVLYILVPFPVAAEGEEDTKQKIEDYMMESIDTYNIPGASLTVVKNEEIFYHDDWGVMSDGSKVTADKPFLIGSLSKPITSLAIMMLVEDGIIKLDEPIENYIPSFAYKTDSSKQITVLHLLEHTSGISEFEGLKVTDKDSTEETIITKSVDELNGVELSHVPGEVYEYNSANYLLLGLIVEEVTNGTYSEFLDKRIFTPLNMRHSAADYETARVLGYKPGFVSWFGKPIKSDGLYDNAGAPYGYIASTTNDLAKFLTFMLEGGELLSEQNLDLLKTPPEEGRTYGLGWHFSKTENFPFHGGATSDHRAEMFFIPEQDVAAVLLTNKYHFTEDRQVSEIMEGIRSIMNGVEPVEVPPQSYTLQWITLGITIMLVILTVVHFMILRRKQRLRRSLRFSLAILFLFLTIGLIPTITYMMGTPWKAIKLYAPDIAFLIQVLVAILAINGIIPFIMNAFKKRTNHKNNVPNLESFSLKK
ncbi:serine hydrolase [Bacillus sp. JCM 19034]|uniref:serine hydrolase domain-containing protein n=1 Tax=Bacillus sp. JCM 19034 TaxID=1481928 RepID=UPI0007867DAD|nr:serine hydrolase domain-containing protein [Bacillus sp. JCM 19034]